MYKRVKEMCKRFGAGFLAIVLLLSLMPMQYAEAAYQDDYAKLIEGNHAIDALKYLGYDIDGLIKDKKLFQIWTGDAITPYLTDIEWTNWNGTTGRETQPASNGEISVTGKVPDVSYFERKGFDCGGFVTYYYYNYLVNIAGVDISDLTKRLPSGANDPASWVTALNRMESKDGTAKLMIDLNDNQDSSDVPNSIWNQLTPGDILIFKTHTKYNADGSVKQDPIEYAHICVFVGMFPCKDKGVLPWMMHQSSSRGACMVPVYNIENINNGIGVAPEKTNQTLNKIFHLNIDSTYEPYGSITVNKKGKETGKPLSGAVFTATNTETGKVHMFPATDSSGTTKLKELPLGKYTVREITPPTNYQMPKVNSWTVEITNETPHITFTVQNELKHGFIAAQKSDEFGKPLSGVTFGIYSDAACRNQLGTMTTNDLGVAKSAELDCTKTYYIKETKTQSSDYVLDTTIHSVVVAANATVWVNNGKWIVNKHKYWQITFEKRDSDNNGLTAGDASVVGAVYGLYNSEDQLLDQYTVGESGSFTTKKYVVGEGFYLKEISAPSGYKLDATEYYLDDYTKPDGSNEPLTAHTVDLKEIVMTGTVSLSKFTADPKNPGIYNVPEVGAEFQVYLKSAGSYENAMTMGDERLYDSGTVNAGGDIVWSNGGIVSKDLAYGTYIVHQVSSWDNRIFVEDFEITILDDNQHFNFNLNNPYYTANIAVNKRDAESGKLIVNGIAAFKILNVDTNEYVVYRDEETGETIDEFLTVDGMLTLPMEIPYGNYLLEETCAPEGYLLDGKTVPFTIDKNSNGILSFDVENEPLMGNLLIDKKGVQFTSVIQNDSNYGPVFAPVYSEDFIAGVQFTIIANEDIVTGDGVIHYKKGDIVDRIVTNGDAAVQTKDLYIGKYLVVETDAPDGVIMTHEPIEIEVTNAGTQKVSTIPVQITNDYIATELNMLKHAYTWETVTVSDTGEVTRKLNMVSGVGFTFGLFAAEDFTAKNGDLIAKDSLVSIMATNELGVIHYTEQLPYGKYYVKELDTPKDHPYIMDTKTYEVDLSVEHSRDNIIVADVNNGEAVVNEFVNFSVTIKKTDLTSAAPVKGALVSIKNADGETIYSVYTDEEGKLPGVLLEPGKYTFTEDIAPAGYIREPETFEFEVLPDGTINGTTEFTNEQTIVELFKVDKGTREPLANAKIRVTNSLGEIVYEGVTDENGKIAIVGILNPGESYEFTEIETPNGYAITATIYSFAVNEDGTISGSNTVENEKTQFSIYKTSPNGLPLAGAEFTMYDMDGNVLDVQVTGEDGIATFTGFGVGTFTIRETKAPDGYELIEGDIVITNDGKWDNYSDMAKFTFVNEPIPGTGDITMPTTIAGIAMGFALFMLAACVIFFKKKTA